MSAAVATPATDGASLRPLLWTCAVFAGGVLLHADRVPPWAAAVALLLIAWRLLSAYRGGGYPGIAARALLAFTLAARQQGADAAKGLESVMVRLRAPNDCRDAAQLVLRQSDAVFAIDNAAAAQRLAVLEAADAFRRPARLDALLDACECWQRAGVDAPDTRSWPARDADGRVKLHADIAHPINSGCREVIQSAVIKSFQEEKERSKQPGYVCTYDDYDGDYEGSFTQVVGELNGPGRSNSTPSYRPHAAHGQRGAHARNSESKNKVASTNENRTDNFGAGIL